MCVVFLLLLISFLSDIPHSVPVYLLMPHYQPGEFLKFTTCLTDIVSMLICFTYKKVHKAL